MDLNLRRKFPFRSFKGRIVTVSVPDSSGQQIGVLPGRQCRRGRVAGHPPAGIFLRGWVELRLCFMPCPVRGEVTALFTLVTQTAAPALSGAITSVQRMSPAWNRSRIFSALI